MSDRNGRVTGEVIRAAARQGDFRKRRRSDAMLCAFLVSVAGFAAGAFLTMIVRMIVRR